MRVALLQILTAWYAIATIGVHIDVHFCCGKITDIGWVALEKSCCGEHTDKSHCSTHSGCCSMAELDYWVDTDHHGVRFHWSPETPAPPVNDVFAFELSDRVVNTKSTPTSGHDPPDPVPPYIAYQSLLLYA